MAIKSGDQIKIDDLSALGTKANGLSGTGMLSNDVVPMYNDGTGAKWGHRLISDFAIVKTDRGTGYRVGDYLQGFGGSLLVAFRVEAVDYYGGLLGVRIADRFPADYSSTLPTSPALIETLFGGASTSGSGAKMAWVETHVGPTLSYSFPEHPGNTGIVTDIVLLNGGAGYQVGDVLTFPITVGAATVTGTVTSVDGSGKIIGCSISDFGFFGTSVAMPQGITNLKPTGGTGYSAIFSGLFILNQIPKWKTELDRMRGHLAEYLSTMQYDASKLAVSGPWPISGPSWSNRDQWFWYADNGTSQSVTVSASFSGGSEAKFETRVVKNRYIETWGGNGWPTGSSPFTGGVPPWVDVYYKTRDEVVTLRSSGGNYDCLYGSRVSFDIIIGGSKSVTLNGVFYIFLPITRGTYYEFHTHGVNGHPGYINTETSTTDLTDPSNLVEDDGSNFPGAYDIRPFHLPAAGRDFLCLSWTCNQTVTPGRYTVAFKIKDSGEDSTTVSNYKGSRLETDPGSVYYGTIVNDPDQNDYRIVTNKPTRVNCIYTPSGGTITFSGAGSLTWGTPDGNGIYPYPSTSGVPSISILYNSPVSADGIHGTKNLKKINLEDGAANQGSLPPGIYGVIPKQTDPPDAVATYHAGVVSYLASTGVAPGGTFLPSEAWKWEPFPQPIFNSEIVGPGGSWGATPTTDGFWSGITAPVSDLHAATAASMPWNIRKTTSKTTPGGWTSYSANPMLLGNGNPDQLGASNSYTQSLPVESQNEPARWAAQKWFTKGFVITDSKGLVLLSCSKAGYSGLVEPVWNLALNATTGETHDPVPTYGRSEWASWQVIKVWKTKKDSTWAALQGRNVGETVIDSNGNTQTVITAGVNGASVPTWATTLGGTTSDGTVTWQLTAIVSGILPAKHRIRATPRYPVYWMGESIAWLKPPTTSAESEKTVWGCGNQWQRNTYVNSSGSVITENGWQQDNLANGWWIYSVSLNRMRFVIKNAATTPTGVPISAGGQQAGAGDAGGASGIVSGAGVDMGEVAVTLGCLRNGSFVSFGTWLTGQTISVLWPVFTSDALTYQCAERVDVQAVAISANSNGVETSALFTTTHPICGAFVNDTMKLLDLVQTP